MAHTYEFEIPGWKKVTLVANSDLSGQATVKAIDDNDRESTAWLPGELLLHLGRQAAIEHLKGEMTSFLEGLEDRVLLASVAEPMLPAIVDERQGFVDARKLVELADICAAEAASGSVYDAHVSFIDAVRALATKALEQPGHPPEPRFLCYQSNSNDPTSWILIEEDGTEDGKGRFFGLTEEACQVLADHYNAKARGAS